MKLVLKFSIAFLIVLLVSLGNTHETKAQSVCIICQSSLASGSCNTQFTNGGGYLWCGCNDDGCSCGGYCQGNPLVIMAINNEPANCSSEKFNKDLSSKNILLNYALARYSAYFNVSKEIFNTKKKLSIL